MAGKSREFPIYAPMSGQVVSLAEVPDKTFSDKTMGDGVAIIPAEGQLYSPVSGYVAAVAEAKHAIGFQTESGLNILVHVGLEAHDITRETTVVHVKEGQRVQAGDLVAEYNLDAFKEKEINTITPVVLINEKEDNTEIIPNVGQVLAGAGEIFKVVEIVAQDEQEPEEQPQEHKEKPEVKEEDASNSLLDLFDSYGADYFKDPKNLIKLGVMFVVTVGVLVTIFVLLGMYLNGGK